MKARRGLTGLRLLRTPLVAACAAAILAACAASRSGKQPATQPSDRSLTPANQQRLQALLVARQQIEKDTDYTIAPGDLLSITIYGFRPGGGNFDSDVRVDDRGCVGLPMMDPVDAAGLSLAQFRKALAESLERAQVMRQPLVSVFLKDYQGQQVIVLGAVARPGLYHLSRGKQTVIDVLSMAGGLTDRAGNYLLIRPAPSAPQNANAADPLKQQYALNTVSVGGGVSETVTDMVLLPIASGENSTLLSLPVLGGDLFAVPDAGQAFVEGEIARPGPYKLTHAMTLTQLVASAGGLLYPADTKRIKLVRTAPNTKSTQWEIDLERIQTGGERDVVLESNDRIVVRATTGRKILYGIYTTFTSITHVAVGGNVPIY